MTPIGRRSLDVLRRLLQHKGAMLGLLFLVKDNRLGLLLTYVIMIAGSALTKLRRRLSHECRASCVPMRRRAESM